MKNIQIIIITVLLIFCVNYTSVMAKENTNVIRLSDDVEVVQLTSGIWLHTTYHKLPKFGRYPANGLIIISGKNALLIDLPWKNAQTGILFDWIEKEHNATVKAVVPTHSHTDCAGGLDEAHKRGADSWAFHQTINKLKEQNGSVPKNGFTKSKQLSCGNIAVELAYLGGGHSTDNIVVWIPKYRVLFAGCLVKSVAEENLGNIKEAEMLTYPKTLQNILKQYAEAALVVPGHGRTGGLELVRHTLKLYNKQK